MVCLNTSINDAQEYEINSTNCGNKDIENKQKGPLKWIVYKDTNKL